MNSLQAWQIVGEQLWFVFGALSVPVGWCMFWDYGQRVPERDGGSTFVFFVLFFWTLGWTTYFITKGWPLD